MESFLLAICSCPCFTSLVASKQGDTPNMKNKIKRIIETLPTYQQRMVAEGVLDLLIEDAISEREAKRQLAVNGIHI